MADHVHMMLSIPPEYAVAQVIGYIKGKSAIHIAREFAGRSRSFVGRLYAEPEHQAALRRALSDMDELEFHSSMRAALSSIRTVSIWTEPVASSDAGK